MELHRKLITDVAKKDFELFDFVLSHNVMEHIFSLSYTLSSCSKVIPNKGDRIVIFADPLFYSSAGGHLEHAGVAPWGRLTQTQESLRASVSEQDYHHYRNKLNGVTLTSFLEGVREAGCCLERLEIVTDRNLYDFQRYLESIPPGLSRSQILRV